MILKALSLGHVCTVDLFLELSFYSTNLPKSINYLMAPLFEGQDKEDRCFKRPSRCKVQLMEKFLEFYSSKKVPFPPFKAAPHSLFSLVTFYMREFMLT
jgi:hypothetical protein